jgi:hypothetical protein
MTRRALKVTAHRNQGPTGANPTAMLRSTRIRRADAPTGREVLTIFAPKTPRSVWIASAQRGGVEGRCEPRAVSKTEKRGKGENRRDNPDRNTVGGDPRLG